MTLNILISVHIVTIVRLSFTRGSGGNRGAGITGKYKMILFEEYRIALIMKTITDKIDVWGKV